MRLDKNFVMAYVNNIDELPNIYITQQDYFY